LHRRTPDDLLRSLQHFQAAIDADPRSALAYCGLADANAVLMHHGLLQPAEGFPKAKAAATQAIQLDPTLAEAYAALAIVSSHCENQWEKAESLYRKAILLNPGYATAHFWLGIDCLAVQGRFDEGLEQIEVAQQLDPLFCMLYEARATVSLFKRSYHEAIRGYHEVLQYDPTFYRVFTSIGRAHIQMGNYSEALAMLEKGRLLGGNVPTILAAMGQALALSGNTAGARDSLAQLRARSTEEYIPCTCFAIIHLGLGENEKALDWLEQACDGHEMSTAVLKVHPVYDDLRSEARFQAFLGNCD
jgi:serine/threonine-protein kinase